MAIEEGKACSRSKEKSYFNRADRVYHHPIERVQNLLEHNHWNGYNFHKTEKWKSMAIEGGKACSRYEEKIYFNRAIGR